MVDPVEEGEIDEPAAVDRQVQGGFVLAHGLKLRRARRPLRLQIDVHSSVDVQFQDVGVPVRDGFVQRGDSYR